MGTLAIIGDQWYLWGIKKDDLEYFRTAKTIFSFERSLISGPAEIYIKRGIINQTSFAELKDMIRSDPYSPKFLSVQMQFAIMLQDNDLALSSYYRLRRIAPQSKILQSVTLKGP